MGVWRQTLGAIAVCLAHTAIVTAQTDSCTINYQAYAGGTVSSAPDASGTLFLAVSDGSVDPLTLSDSGDEVMPPFAPPGGWFVALSNPADSGLYWARADARMLDPDPGTHITFQILLHPRFSETAIDSVEVGWPGTCFTAPNVTVLSMAHCGSEEMIVPDMTAVDAVGIGRLSSPAWDDEQICLAVGARDDLVASVRLFLEGPFNGTGMSVPSTFSDEIPFGQPYSDAIFDGTPLDHDGPELATVLPGSTIDWILVGLRASETAESAVDPSMHAAVLLSDGTIVEADGSQLRFPGLAPNGYRLVARHRNHLSVLSSDTLDMSDGVGSWDFTTSLAQAYSDGGAPMKNLGAGMFGLFATDGSVDGQVTAPDFNLWNAATTAGQTGYVPSDFNMDGQVTAPDFNLWNANTTAGASSQVPE